MYTHHLTNMYTHHLTYNVLQCVSHTPSHTSSHTHPLTNMYTHLYPPTPSGQPYYNTNHLMVMCILL
jgi:hypothetical protein